jgi:RimJ/RimL family protein N-acetyltransferase
VAATLWPGQLGGARSREQVEQRIAEEQAHWRDHGFGPWTFFERNTGRLVGRGGLRRTDVGGPGGTELLYAVAAPLWGNGYATEIALASVEAARALGLTELVGYTLTTNVASQRLLEKAGLTRERDIEHAGLPHWLGRLRLLQ